MAIPYKYLQTISRHWHCVIDRAVGETGRAAGGKQQNSPAACTAGKKGNEQLTTQRGERMESIIESLDEQVNMCREFDEPFDRKSWHREWGVLLTPSEATQVINCLQKLQQMSEPVEPSKD